MARAKRILLVDDDELLRSTLMEQFNLNDEFEVDCAANGQEAMEIAKREAHIDLMLLDVGLPDMDGREACPFKFVVLLARVRAHLRSHEQSEDAVFKIGPYEFRPAVKMLVTQDDRKIRLTEKETSILKYLYRAGGKAVSRDVLLDEVWGYNSGVTTHTLETHVYRLRQKIEPEPSNASILVTESGGYRLAL